MFTCRRHCQLILPATLLLLAGTISVRAEEVTIIRDKYGVPHIFADSPEAATYALGFAQCEDNLGTVIDNLFAGVGRLSEVTGPRLLDRDIKARQLGHGHFARRDWPKLSAGLQRLIQSYCDGVNAYLKAHPNELPFDVPKVEPVQVMAAHRSVFLLSALKISQLDAEASKSDGYHPVYSPNDGAAKHPGVPPGKSNSWVLAGSKTKAGVPMLLIDPHWATKGPLQLYEAYLHGGELQCGGFMINGTPFPGIGFTPAAAWTVTAGGADSSDAYALRINPQNPRQYEFDGRWEDMTVRRETIRMRTADGPRTHVVEVLSTRHGPVLKTESGIQYAAAFSGHDQADTIEQNYRMLRARNTREFKAALAMDRYSYFNLVWATTAGDIGYVQTGAVPRRPAGFNWHKMVPGWTSRSLYQGRLPFEKLPIVENPDSGFLQNCNVAANVVTPGLKFKKEDFAIGALWGHYGQYRARGQRATQLLSEIKQATLEDGRRIAFDTYVPPADLWIPVLLRAYRDDKTARDKATAGLLAEGIEILRKWDRFATRDSQGATVFRFWRLECDKLKSAVGRDRFVIPNSPEIRRDALHALLLAVKRLKTTYGRVAVPWGEIKVLQRGKEQWPLSGDGLGQLGMDTLRATAPGQFNAQHKLVFRGGQCVTSVVLLTKSPTIRSVVPYGQSNKSTSKHFADQAPLYSREQLRVVGWTRQQLQGQIESETVLEY